MRVSRQLKRRAQRGASMVEVALIVGVVALGVLAAFAKFGSSIKKALGDQGKCVEQVGGGGGGEAGGGGGGQAGGGGGGQAGGGGGGQAGGGGGGGKAGGGGGQAGGGGGGEAGGGGGGGGGGGDKPESSAQGKAKEIMDKIKGCKGVLDNMNKKDDQVGQCPNDKSDFSGRLLTEVQQGIGGMPALSDTDMTSIASQCGGAADGKQVACATEAVGVKLKGYDADHQTAALGSVLGKMGIQSDPVCNQNTSYNKAKDKDGSTKIASAIAECVMGLM